MNHSTNNYIAEYIVDKLYPMVMDGYIPTIHDPVIGDGGFILISIKYLHERYPGINWEVNKLNISGYEIDSNIHYSTLQYLYNYTNIDFSNTIINYDCIKIYNPSKYDIIMADPGITNCRRNSHTEISFIKYVINMLNIDGRAAIIVNDRCLTSNKKKYIKIRRKLLSKFNLHHVVSINLSEMNEKYSILFFDNTGPTDTIDFYTINSMSQYSSSLVFNPTHLIETYDTTLTHEQIAFNYYHINSYKKHVYIDNIIIDSDSDTSESSTTSECDRQSIESITSEDDETLLSNTIDMLKL